jgi:hypothetical protein
MRSLAERMRAFEQRKAKLADVEAKLKLAERRSHLRRCIRIGDLAVKAGLADLSDEALYGAMLALAKEGPAAHQRWSTEGAAALAAQKPDGADRQPVVLTFATPPVAAVVETLRTCGFRYNRLLRHWEGLVDVEEASALAQSHGGVARAVTIDG